MLSNHYSRAAAALLGCFLLLLAASGCSHKEQPRQFPFRGTVVSIDPNAKVASIHNEDVPGWMTAMTMEYPIENAAEFQSLHPGDNITATVNVTSDRYWLTNIHEAPK
jgi:Cu/Ag efflux protein CusF